MIDCTLSKRIFEDPPVRLDYGEDFSLCSHWIKTQILSLLENNDLRKCAEINKSFFLLCRSNILWEEQLHPSSEKVQNIFYLHLESIKHEYEKKGYLNRDWIWDPNVAFADQKILCRDYQCLRILDIERQEWKECRFKVSRHHRFIKYSESQNVILSGGNDWIEGHDITSLSTQFSSYQGIWERYWEGKYSQLKVSDNFLIRWPRSDSSYCTIWKFQEDEINQIGSIRIPGLIPMRYVGIGNGVLAFLVNRKIEIWDLETASLRYKIEKKPSGKLTIFQNQLYAQDFKGDVHVYSIETEKEEGTFISEKFNHYWSPKFTLNEKYLVTIGDTGFTVFDRESRQKIYAKEFKRYRLDRIKCRIEKNLIFLSKKWGKVEIIVASTGECVQVIENERQEIAKIHAKEDLLIINFKRKHYSTLYLYILNKPDFPKLENVRTTHIEETPEEKGPRCYVQ